MGRVTQVGPTKSLSNVGGCAFAPAGQWGVSLHRVLRADGHVSRVKGIAWSWGPSSGLHQPFSPGPRLLAQHDMAGVGRERLSVPHVGAGGVNQCTLVVMGTGDGD